MCQNFRGKSTKNRTYYTPQISTKNQIQKNRKKANYTLIRVCSFVTALGLTIAAPFFIKGKTSKGKIYYPTKITTTKVDFNDYYSLINTNETEMYDKEQKENHITLKVIEHGKETYTINGKSNKTDKISDNVKKWKNNKKYEKMC